MTRSILTVWLGLVLIAAAVWPTEPLLVLIPGIAAVVIGLLLEEA